MEDIIVNSLAIIKNNEVWRNIAFMKMQRKYTVWIYWGLCVASSCVVQPRKLMHAVYKHSISAPQYFGGTTDTQDAFGESINYY